MSDRVGNYLSGNPLQLGNYVSADMQAFCALSVSPGARTYYDQLRARGTGHRAALRQLANRPVGILHGCLKTGTPCDETRAWPLNHQDLPATAA